MIINQIWISDTPTPPLVLNRARRNESKAFAAGFKYKFWEKSSIYRILEKDDRVRFDAIKNNIARCDFTRYHVLKRNNGIYIDMDDWMHFDSSHKNEYFISRLRKGKGFIVNAILRIPEEVSDCVIKQARDFIDQRGVGDARAIGIIPLRRCINAIEFKHRYIAMPGKELCSPGKNWQTSSETSWKGQIDLWDEPKTMKEELNEYRR
jgi:hypothetical protein